MTAVKELSVLEALGLKESEARIYQALLERGPASIRQVAADTAINRGAVYEGLKRLVGFGLVSFTRKGERRKFVAERPEKIYELIAEKQRELTQTEERAQKLVPELLAIGQPGEGEPRVRFYEDDEGIVAILRDVINTTSAIEPKEYYVYSSKPIRQYIYRRFPNFTRRRIKEKIFVRTIAIGEGGEPAEVAERKWLAEPTHRQLSSYIIIYGDKLALISVSADDTPYGVVIEEPGVAATQKYLFEQLWQSLPKPSQKARS